MRDMTLAELRLVPSKTARRLMGAVILSEAKNLAPSAALEQLHARSVESPFTSFEGKLRGAALAQNDSDSGSASYARHTRLHACEGSCEWRVL